MMRDDGKNRQYKKIFSVHRQSHTNNNLSLSTDLNLHSDDNKDKINNDFTNDGKFDSSNLIGIPQVPKSRSPSDWNRDEIDYYKFKLSSSKNSDKFLNCIIDPEVSAKIDSFNTRYNNLRFNEMIKMATKPITTDTKALYKDDFSKEYRAYKLFPNIESRVNSMIQLLLKELEYDASIY
jgi:hypothetical protein